MVEHVQPIVDRVGEAPALRETAGRRLLERTLGWAGREALLFPVVALFLIALAGNLPRELFQDSWLAILGGREVVQHGQGRVAERLQLPGRRCPPGARARLERRRLAGLRARAAGAARL